MIVAGLLHIHSLFYDAKYKVNKSAESRVMVYII